MTTEHDHTADAHGEHGDHDHGQADGAADGHDHEHHHHEGPHDYVGAIEQYRAEKDAFFKSAPGSPIPQSDREDFSGLPYYPVDVELVFEGLTPEPYRGSEPTAFQIPTSDGGLRPARRAGTFTFELGGERRQLTAYEFDGSPSDGGLFLPFLDATSGTETYGAGRYLDLEPDEDGTYAIDFNLAYHPSCVYAPNYSCPLTPAENRLPVPIHAGERLAEGGAH
ncbi:MAG TPA: DUF1684 domain-containing protein [Candidatus Limnocylindrales bacterium]|nr:DUF1684 domain-containing protein [Candidatus Limnocylindrales bacterium]